jgi:hypothetical protein
MKNVLKNLWNKLFGKTEEPQKDTTMDVGLKAYIDSQLEPTVAAPIIIVSVPEVQPVTLTETIVEPIVEPIEAVLPEVRVKRKYTKKVVPAKKAPVKKMTKKAPAKKAVVKKAPVKKTTKKKK